MYYVYILKSLKINWYYVGHTSNTDNRLIQHNNGENKSTKKYIPLVLIYSEIFSTKSEAFKREQQIKSYKHGEAFKKLISA